MAESERLVALAHKEIATHQEEAQRLHDMADQLVTSAEYHLRQAERWQGYLGQLAVGKAQIPTQRHLFVVKD